jgi:Spy/CpxP family protein refolding chaperone
LIRGVEMPGMSTSRALLVAPMLACGICAYGADSGSTSGKPLKMDEPMPIKMKKPGMKKSDVKKAAEAQERAMKAMMDKESAGGAKK